MKNIPIYHSEIANCLQSRIKQQRSISYNTLIEQSSILPHDLPIKNISVNECNDLFPIAAILASTNWNLNDDIFVAEEIWKAKDSPINKPFNIEHSCDDIIGHIVGSYCMNIEDGQVINPDSPIDWVPKNLHIVTDSVIYKRWHGNPSKENIIADLIAEIKDHQWFVSMECYIEDFDYAMLNLDTKNISMIRRDENTAFLTQYLRCYGGKGVYISDGKNIPHGEYRIGRILRSLEFIGKGLVKNPANVNSVIFAEKINVNSEPFKRTVMNQEINETIETTETPETVMASTIEALTAELSEANKLLGELKAKIANDENEKIRVSRINAFVKIGASDTEAKSLFDKFVSLNDEQFSSVVEAYSAKFKIEPQDGIFINKGEQIILSRKDTASLSINSDNVSSENDAVAQILIDHGAFKFNQRRTS